MTSFKTTNDMARDCVNWNIKKPRIFINAEGMPKEQLEQIKKEFADENSEHYIWIFESPTTFCMICNDGTEATEQLPNETSRVRGIASSLPTPGRIVSRDWIVCVMQMARDPQLTFGSRCKK